MGRVRVARAGGGLVLVLALLLGGCGGDPAPGPVVRSAPAAPTPGSVAVPSDGLLLGEFGYRFGPRDSFSLPRSARLAAAVDQADGVTVVLSAPPAAEVAAYLRRALPATGWTVTAEAAPSTLTFTGHGWRGSFTGNGDVSAVLLRPG